MTVGPHVAADGTVLTDNLEAELAAEADAGLAGTTLAREPAPWRRQESMESLSMRSGIGPHSDGSASQNRSECEPARKATRISSASTTR